VRTDTGEGAESPHPLPLAEKHKDEHIHDDDKCCECGDERHCCCDCPQFCDEGADPDVTKGKTWKETYPT
jgi:hypothetical protein